MTVARPTEADIVGEVLRAAGIEYTTHVGRKHVKVRWDIAGRGYSYSCAKTPSDWRAYENCRCSVRRVLRAAGVQA